MYSLIGHNWRNVKEEKSTSNGIVFGVAICTPGSEKMNYPTE